MMESVADARSSADVANTELAKKVRLFLNANRTGFRGVGVWADEGTVRLSGSLRSFFLRQMAVALAKRVAGVRHVLDDLEVDLEEVSSDRKVEPQKLTMPVCTTGEASREF